MLKAVLFDFNGVIVNDEPLHEQLIEQLLLAENLRPKRGEFRQICLGRSDRACIKELFESRGRVLTEKALDDLVARKAAAYQQELAKIEAVPSYPGLQDFLFNVRGSNLKTAIVSGALRSEIELVLQRLGLQEVFPVIVSGDDLKVSKPEPDGYLLAVERLNAAFPGLNAAPGECLAIEDTFAGIEAAKRAQIPVVGVAHTYPFHMLQRRANWTVDYLTDLEWERLRQLYDRAIA